MLKIVYFLCFFLLVVMNGQDLYIFDDFSHNKKSVSLKNNVFKKYKYSKKRSHVKNNKTIKHIKKLKSVVIPELKTVKQKEKHIKKEKISLSPKVDKLKTKSIKELLYAYKKKLQKGEVDKNLFIHIKKKIASIDDNKYDNLAMVNALEDIQTKNIKKYEAILILDTMIKEITQ